MCFRMQKVFVLLYSFVFVDPVVQLGLLLMVG